MKNRDVFQDEIIRFGSSHLRKTEVGNRGFDFCLLSEDQTVVGYFGVPGNRSVIRSQRVNLV